MNKYNQMKKAFLFIFLFTTTSLLSQTNPTGADNLVNTNEDIDRIFSAADFGYNDADGDPFTQIEIFSTVSVGTLFLDANDDNIVDGGEAVVATQVILIGDINLNRLKFRPVPNANGASYDNFRFYVNDGVDGNSLANYLMDINVNAVNDDPAITTNNGATLNEDAIHIIVQAELETTDVEQAANNLTYTINAIPVNGTLHNGGGPALIVGNTFTQNDININNITYDHDGGETTTDAFTFTVTDGVGGTTLATVFNITITPVNDVPVLAFNNGATVNEASTNNIIPNTALQVTDADNTPVQITYTVSTVPTNGTLYNNAIALAVTDNFTQDDINNNRLTYDHDGSETIADNFQFTVADGAGGNIGATTFSITVTPVNDNPVVTTNTGKTVNEASTGNVILISELQTTDNDNTPAQLTYTLTVVPVNGTLHNGGGPALIVGNTFTQNDINSNNITYDHDGSETLSDSFTFTLADGAGGTVPATVFNLTITPVNDVPVLAFNTGSTINEASTNNVIPNTALQVTDADNTPVQITYTISTVPTNGTLYNNAIALVVTDNFTQDDIDNNRLTYDHDGSETIADNFQFTVADGAGGNIGVTTFNITITAVNDDPVFTSTPITTGQEGVLYTYNITTTDSDLPADVLTITAPTIPPWLMLTDNGDGTASLSGTPPDGSLRNNPVVINVNDGTVDIQQSYTLIVSYDITVPGNFATIQLAIDASVNGDIVSVSNGTYNENINFNGKEIEVIGNTADPTQVIIDGGGTGSVVIFENGEGGITTLNGFTIQNGGGTLGVPVTFSPYAPASGYYGGGIYCYQSNPLLKNIIVENNSLGTNNDLGSSGAGIYIGRSTNVIIEGPFTIIRNNTSAIYRGGGICIDNSTVTIDGTTGTVEISNNSGGNYGGGIAMFLSDITLNNVDINNNDASGSNGDGGGVFRLGYSVFNQTNLNFNGNTSTLGINDDMN